MSSGKSGVKAQRGEQHKNHQRALREAKKLRAKRAKAHAAYQEALRLKRSKRKGTADLDANMAAQGYKRRRVGQFFKVDREGGDILNKWEEIS